MTTAELPRALQPWRQWLGWFDAELAPLVGDMVRRLSDLTGPATAASGRSALEPDGLGDLRTRGHYERLLTQEWLLADEVPLEFLRRAASGEHLFLAPALRALPSERQVVAVFDAGPRQLGAPRAAHLAAWILLARRAGLFKGQLRWGILQQPGEWRDDEGQAALRALLSARSLKPDDETLRERWRAAAKDASDAEVWWVGAPWPAEATLPPREHLLALRHGWSADTLDVTLANARGRRSARLPLPADVHVGALLRGQFAKALALPAPTGPRRADTHHRLSMMRRPLIQTDGSLVAAFTVEKHAALLVFRRKGQDRVKTRHEPWSPQRGLISAGLKSGQLFGIGLDSTHLHFWKLPQWPALPRPPLEAFTASHAMPAFLPLAYLKSGHQDERVCVIDQKARLIAWHRVANGTTVMVQLDEQVMGMITLGRQTRLVYAIFYGQRLWLRTLSADGSPSPLKRWLLAVDSPMAPVFLCTRPANEGQLPIGIAGRLSAEDGETWGLLQDEGVSGLLDTTASGPNAGEVQLRPGEQAMGLVWSGAKGSRQLHLVVLGSRRQTLRLHPPLQAWPLLTTTGKIMQVTVCPHTGVIAALTDIDRGLHVIDGRTGSPLMHLSSQQGADAHEAVEADA